MPQSIQRFLGAVPDCNRPISIWNIWIVWFRHRSTRRYFSYPSWHALGFSFRFLSNTICTMDWRRCPADKPIADPDDMQATSITDVF